MNKIYIILLLILGVNFTPVWSQCTDHEISTHPNGAINTLYTIQQQKQLEALTMQLNALQEKLNDNEGK